MQLRAVRGVCKDFVLLMSGKKKAPYVFLNRITCFRKIFFGFVFYFKKKKRKNSHFPISAISKMFQKIIYILFGPHT